MASPGKRMMASPVRSPVRPMAPLKRMGGVLPNPMEENMFMAVSMDTYYQDEVHPRNKQLPGKRLGIAGLAVAYKIPNLPTRGPFPASFDFHLAPHSMKVDLIVAIT